jgi:uncharacterized protein YfaS (alpha-2-macroglobulin family)
MTMISPKGFNKIREFYTPRYDVPSRIKMPDYRTTIYWNASVTTKEGKASVAYFNADALGTYRVTVEGLTPNGNLGRVVYRYKVE